MTIRNGQSRDIDIDIHKKKTLEIVQSCLENLQTLVSRLFIHDYTISNACFLVYVDVSVSGFLIPDCPISNVFFLCMSMSVSVDCPFLIVTFLTS
jgi:hypothetical protein